MSRFAQIRVHQRSMKISRSLAVIAFLTGALVIGSIGCGRAVYKEASQKGPADKAALMAAEPAASADALDALISKEKAVTAPELASGEWINSSALSSADLRGHVVLLDFWTFLCSNCINTLPTLKRLDEDYRSKGLIIVGVETPELESERSPDALRTAVKTRDIEYPVVTDYNSASWDAYSVNAWPTVVILDKAGRIRYRHIGEGAYDVEENVVRTLLEEDGNSPVAKTEE